MRLYIIRHGETEWNKEKRMQGQRDIMLDQEGIRLAALTGKGMQDVPIDIAISSPLLRAKQTAQLVLANRAVPIITDERIQEMSFGDWEGESISDSKVVPQEFIENSIMIRCIVSDRHMEKPSPMWSKEPELSLNH